MIDRDLEAIILSGAKVEFHVGEWKPRVVAQFTLLEYEGRERYEQPLRVKDLVPGVSDAEIEGAEALLRGDARCFESEMAGEMAGAMRSARMLARALLAVITVCAGAWLALGGDQ